MFAMSGDGTDDVKIPVVFLFKKEADELLAALTENSDLEVSISKKLLTKLESKRFTYFFQVSIMSFVTLKNRIIAKEKEKQKAEEKQSNN
jgi:hypothetical protein